jgi:hypothetical protein
VCEPVPRIRRATRPYHQIKEISRGLYQRFQRDKFASSLGIRGYSLAEIQPRRDRISLTFTPPTNDKQLEMLLKMLERKYELRFEGRVLESIDEYCNAYQGYTLSRNPASSGLFEHVLSDMDEFLFRNGIVYTEVPFFRHGKPAAWGDIVQINPGGIMVAKLNIVSSEASKRRCPRKNQVLRAAQAFLEQRGYGLVQAIRIDGIYDAASDRWRIGIGNATQEDCPWYRKV